MICTWLYTTKRMTCHPATFAELVQLAHCGAELTRLAWLVLCMMCTNGHCESGHAAG
jgi:hypothetical protein